MGIKTILTTIADSIIEATMLMMSGVPTGEEGGRLAVGDV